MNGLWQLTAGVRPTSCPDGTAFGMQDQTKKEEVHIQTLKRGSDTQTFRDFDSQTVRARGIQRHSDAQRFGGVAFLAALLLALRR